MTQEEGGILLVVEDDLTGAAIKALLQDHFANMHAITPPGSAHVLDIERLRSPDITFWSAWEGDRLMGCGALKALDAKRGEVKSMRTVETYRRSGVGSTIVNHMIGVAKQRGYAQLYLETGSFPAFQAARSFYEKHGFEYTTPFDQYKEDPNSVFMSKRL